MTEGVQVALPMVLKVRVEDRDATRDARPATLRARERAPSMLEAKCRVGIHCTDSKLLQPNTRTLEPSSRTQSIVVVRLWSPHSPRRKEEFLTHILDVKQFVEAKVGNLVLRSTTHRILRPATTHYFLKQRPRPATSTTHRMQEVTDLCCSRLFQLSNARSHRIVLLPVVSAHCFSSCPELHHDCPMNHEQSLPVPQENHLPPSRRSLGIVLTLSAAVDSTAGPRAFRIFFPMLMHVQ